MDKTRAVEFLVFLTAMILGAFIYLNEHHAADARVTVEVFEIKADELSRDIARDNQVRDYYEKMEKEAGLNDAQQGRLDYINRGLDRKYNDEKRLRDSLSRLKEEGQ